MLDTYEKTLDVSIEIQSKFKIHTLLKPLYCSV